MPPVLVYMKSLPDIPRHTIAIPGAQQPRRLGQDAIQKTTASHFSVTASGEAAELRTRNVDTLNRRYLSGALWTVR